ncbi:unnamed protein product [Macrosiphum euphorbiae]|uniref:Uncharacterized protein n=1 Tax=Macrosiphum euphorbiae TaxID=13131 RepID=A0AAV0XBG0_9HEMI|nr:unnamed protein product [Macrosiphum euphorbiae]
MAAATRRGSVSHKPLARFSFPRPMPVQNEGLDQVPVCEMLRRRKIRLCVLVRAVGLKFNVIRLKTHKKNPTNYYNISITNTVCVISSTDRRVLRRVLTLAHKAESCVVVHFDPYLVYFSDQMRYCVTLRRHASTVIRRNYAVTYWTKYDIFNKK